MINLNLMQIMMIKLSNYLIYPIFQVQEYMKYKMIKKHINHHINLYVKVL